MTDSKEIIEEIEKLKMLIGENRVKINDTYHILRKRFTIYLITSSIVNYVIGFVSGFLTLYLINRR